jgi:hypothetical protein
MEEVKQYMDLIGKPGKKNLKKEGRALKRLLISFVLVVALLVVPVAGALAATDTVEVTATPSYIAISNAPDTWTLNNATGSGTGVIEPATTYYSNPLGEETAPSATVLAGECLFTITNTSSVPTNVVVDIEDFTGGSDPMTNSNDGSNDAGIFGAYSWYEGMTYSSKVVAETNASASAILYSNLGATTNLNWGMETLTQSDAWTGGTSSTATITITVTAA